MLTNTLCSTTLEKESIFTPGWPQFFSASTGMEWLRNTKTLNTWLELWFALMAKYCTSRKLSMKCQQQPRDRIQKSSLRSSSTCAAQLANFTDSWTNFKSRKTLQQTYSKSSFSARVSGTRCLKGQKKAAGWQLGCVKAKHTLKSSWASVRESNKLWRAPPCNFCSQQNFIS